LKNKIFVIGLALTVFGLFNFVAVIEPIDATLIEISRNSTDLLKLEKEATSTDSDMIQELNNVLISKCYYKQPLIKTWSGSEVEYIIEMNKSVFHRDRKYRILINENPVPTTRYAYRSRLDVIEYRSSNKIFKRDYSVILSNEQADQILKILKEYGHY